MRSLLLLLPLVVYGCAKDSKSTTQDIQSGPSADVSAHLEFRAFDANQNPLTNFVVADRSFRTYRSDKSWQSGSPNFVSVDVTKGRIPDRGQYEFTFDVRGTGGVSGLDDALNADVTMFLPELTPGKIQTCSSQAQGPGACEPETGIYSARRERPLFDPRSSFTCFFELGADSAALTFADVSEAYDGHRYTRTSPLPFTPGDSYSPDAGKPLSFAIYCRDDASGEKLLYATYSQNGAGIPKLF